MHVLQWVLSCSDRGSSTLVPLKRGRRDTIFCMCVVLFLPFKCSYLWDRTRQLFNNFQKWRIAPASQTDWGLSDSGKGETNSMNYRWQSVYFTITYQQLEQIHSSCTSHCAVVPSVHSLPLFLPPCIVHSDPVSTVHSGSVCRRSIHGLSCFTNRSNSCSVLRWAWWVIAEQIELYCPRSSYIFIHS